MLCSWTSRPTQRIFFIGPASLCGSTRPQRRATHARQGALVHPFCLRSGGTVAGTDCSLFHRRARLERQRRSPDTPPPAARQGARGGLRPQARRLVPALLHVLDVPAAVLERGSIRTQL